MNQVKTDKDFPHLAKAANAAEMAAGFETFFQKEYPELGLTVDRCEINRVYHKPGKKCEITYRIFGANKRQRAYDQWFYAVMLKDSERGLTPGRESVSSWPGCDFWKPVSVFKDMNTILYAFPYNRKMPYLSKLLDEEFIRQKIDDNLSGFGLDDTWACQEVKIEKLKYRHGKSCVLRYHSVLENDAGKLFPITFFSKTHSDHLGIYVYDVLSDICSQDLSQHAVLHIPRPLAYIEETNTLWQEAWTGEALRSLGERSGWENFLTSELIQNIAGLLAELHQVQPPAVLQKSEATIEWTLDEASDKMEKIIRHLPDHETQLQAVLTAMKHSVFSAHDIQQTLIHGTFKMSQILHWEGRLALIDFDAVALGDPLYDVAEFTASLNYLMVTEGVSRIAVKQAVEVFLTGYEKSSGRSLDRRRLSFYIIALMLGKMHSLLKKIDSRTDAQIEAAFELLKEWKAYHLQVDEAHYD